MWVRQCLQMPQHVGAFAGVDGRRLRQLDGTALHRYSPGLDPCRHHFAAGAGGWSPGHRRSHSTLHAATHD